MAVGIHRTKKSIVESLLNSFLICVNKSGVKTFLMIFVALYIIMGFYDDLCTLVQLYSHQRSDVLMNDMFIKEQGR